MTRPPHLAESLLRWSLADDEREAVLGDLQEEFAALAAEDPARAARWYWSQALLSIGPNVLRRVRRDADRARRSESAEHRKTRMRVRKWALPLLIIAVAQVAFTTRSGPDLTCYLAWYFGVKLVASFLPRRSDDALAEVIRSRRSAVFWWCFIFAEASQDTMFGHTRLLLDAQWLSFLIGGTVLVWPEKYWLFGTTPIAPALVPGLLRSAVSQVRTPFTGLRPASDGSVSLTVDAPDTALSLADPIIVRSGERHIGIDRVFSSADSLRVFSVVGVGATPPHVILDLVDSSGHVRTSISPVLQPAQVVAGGKAPTSTPKVPPLEIDATVSLGHLEPGRYVLRLTAFDVAARSEKYAEFRIAEH